MLLKNVLSLAYFCRFSVVGDNSTPMTIPRITTFVWKIKEKQVEITSLN